jgi:hypothetical protein
MILKEEIVNRREFLHPFVDKSLLPTRSPFSIFGWLGYFNAALAGGLAAGVTIGCSSGPPTTPTPPPSNPRLQPVSEVTASNGTKALLRHFGYASRDQQSLLDAMRASNLNPRIRETGFGDGTWEVSNATFGWIFYVQNQFFGSDTESIRLNTDHLWAAYEKQSIG